MIFENFNMVDGIPIYYQIIKYIKKEIIARRVVDSDEMPSRRALSALIGINPNTIQKAYKQLEEEGIIENRPGAKSYVSVSEDDIRRISEELIIDGGKDFLLSMKEMNLSKEYVIDLIEKLWGENNEK